MTKNCILMTKKQFWWLITVFYYATKCGHILVCHVIINLVINVVIYLVIDSNMTKLMTKYMIKLMTNEQAINDQNKNDQFWLRNKRP